MVAKPTSAAGYTPDYLELVRSTCLYIATKLGDLMQDLVVVGGLAPSLLVDQENLPAGADRHVGTIDLDVGLTVALLDKGRYAKLSDRLRRAGFEPDENEQGNPTRQRWRIGGAEEVTLDFLIPPTLKGDEGGTIRSLEADFAALITPGLGLAFLDKRHVTLSGETILGERATRDVWVCGPGAYVVLKALAVRNRGDNKDAYDLYYVLRNFGAGVGDVATLLRPLLTDEAAIQAIAVLRADFLDHQAIGPRRVAEFVFGEPNDTLQADVVGFVSEFLRLLEAGAP
jgi:hypothetical protein